MFTKPLQGAVFKKAASFFVGHKLELQGESIFMFSINITDEPQGSLQLAPPPILQCVPCRLLTNCVNSWVECIICKGHNFHWFSDDVRPGPRDPYHPLIMCARCRLLTTSKEVCVECVMCRGSLFTWFTNTYVSDYPPAPGEEDEKKVPPPYVPLPYEPPFGPSSPSFLQTVVRVVKSGGA